MKSAILMTGLLALTVAAGSTAAQATIVKVTLTGDSENISDRADVFGLGVTTITDQPFVETFMIDTAGGNVASTSSFVSFNSIFGMGPPYAVGGSITINDHTFSTLGSNYSYASASGDYQIGSNDVVPGTSADNNFYMDLTGTGLPTSVTQPITLTIDGTIISSANDGFIDNSSGGMYSDAAGELYPTAMTVVQVPEPATFALLLTGGATIWAGLVATRRRRTTSRSFYQ